MTKTRRRFLEDSLFAAAAAALSTATCPQVFAADQDKTSANETLSAGVIGVRGRGNAHIAGMLAAKGVEVTYLCDADEKVGQLVAEKVAKKQNGRKPKFVKDMREMYDDKSLDIVTTATPNHWHSLASIWAIQAGKDMYVEKPVSHNVSEGRRVVEAARKYNQICQTGTQARSAKATQDAVAYVLNGNIGEVKMARVLCYNRRKSIGPKGIYKVPAEVDYSLWLGPAQQKPVTRPRFHYDWHWQWDYGNGDLGNQGIHQMDIARWGLGIDCMSDRVLSYGGRLGYEDAGETANTQVAIHEFGDKTLAFEVRGLETKKYMDTRVGVIFYGTKGYVLVPSNYTKAVALDIDFKPVKKFSGGGSHYDNFIAAVRSRNYKDLTADILEGHLSSALCHTSNIAYRVGNLTSVPEVKKMLGNLKNTNENENALETFDRVTAHLTDNGINLDNTTLGFSPSLEFDPKTETFRDNEKANAMLTREYRKPFVVPAAGQV